MDTTSRQTRATRRSHLNDTQSGAMATFLRWATVFAIWGGPVILFAMWSGSSPFVRAMLLCGITLANGLYCLGTLFPALGLFGPVRCRFETAKQEVWLTLDDGPDPDLTPRVLDLLAAHGAKATFFVVGKRAAAHSVLILRMLAEGHSLGNHTQRHLSAMFWCLPWWIVGREIDRCSETLREICGVAPLFFRPPVGMVTPFVPPVVKRRSMDLVLWSVRGFDAMGANAETVAQRVLQQTDPGAIVVLHPERTEEGLHALSLILDGLARRGLTCAIPEQGALRSE